MFLTDVVGRELIKSEMRRCNSPLTLSVVGCALKFPTDVVGRGVSSSEEACPLTLSVVGLLVPKRPAEG